MIGQPPPIYPKKKTKVARVILIILLCLIIICVAIVIVSQKWSKTPEGQAAGTQHALTAAAKPTREPIIITIANTSSNAKTPRPTKTQRPTPTITVTKTTAPTVTTVPLSFFEVANKYFTLTDLQWKEYAQSLIGSRVKWTGYVNNVDISFGSYYVLACVYYNYVCGGFVAQFEVPQNDAYLYKKGQQITFSGSIESSNDIYIHLSDVIVEK